MRSSKSPVDVCLRLVFALVTGFGGILAGGIAGAVVGQFVTGEKGLHGLDPPALFSAAVGMIVGLLVGVRSGTVIATKLGRFFRIENESDGSNSQDG